MSDIAKKMKKIISRNGGNEALMHALRRLLFPQDGMSDPIKRGLSVLSTLEDRDLFELFAQHVGEVPRERLSASLVNRLKTKVPAEQILVAAPSFERWLILADQLRPDESLADQEFDWDRKYELDGLDELRKLAKFHEFELRKLLEETKKFPSLARNKELNRHVEVLRKVYAEVLRIEVATGMRKAAPTDINMNVDAGSAFQELMTATSREKTSTMQVIDTLLKVVHEKDSNEPDGD